MNAMSDPHDRQRVLSISDVTKLFSVGHSKGRDLYIDHRPTGDHFESSSGACACFTQSGPKIFVFQL